MIWLALAGIAILALVPLAASLMIGGRIRGRRDAALALHRAQLDELDRDLAEGRLLPDEHAAARLEVQRRLLAEAEQTEAGGRSSGPLPLMLAAGLVPAVALLIYVQDGGAPDYKTRAAQAEAQAQDEARNGEVAKELDMIQRLRVRLTELPPHSDGLRRGYILLGQSELSVGHLPEAADAFRHALAEKFEPSLGAETAEIITESEAKVTPEAAALFKRALAEAPADVPWRKDAEKRVAEAGGS
jgi:cytochrome c-type biogenesis protein CcmH